MAWSRTQFFFSLTSEISDPVPCSLLTNPADVKGAARPKGSAEAQPVKYCWRRKGSGRMHKQPKSSLPPNTTTSEQHFYHDPHPISCKTEWEWINSFVWQKYNRGRNVASVHTLFAYFYIYYCSSLCFVSQPPYDEFLSHLSLHDKYST